MMGLPFPELGEIMKGTHFGWWEIEIWMFHLGHKKFEMAFRYIMKA